MWGHESSLSHPTHSAEAASLMSASNAVHTFRYKSSGSGRSSPSSHCSASFFSSEVAIFTTGGHESNLSHASHRTEVANSLSTFKAMHTFSDTRALARGDPIPRCTVLHRLFSSDVAIISMGGHACSSSRPSHRTEAASRDVYIHRLVHVQA